MAFLGLKVPPETARLLAEAPWGGDLGEKEDPSKFHITLVYLGKAVPIEKIAQMIAPLFDVVSKTPPFTVSTSHVTTFPPNPDDGVPIICPVQSSSLHALRASIVSALDNAGIDFNKKYPEYKPHVTVGYSQDPQVHGVVNADFPALEWGAHEIVLWGGDQGDNRLLVTFPLNINAVTASTRRSSSIHRAFVQLANNWVSH